MENLTYENFRLKFGGSPPSPLLEFLSNDLVRGSMPARFQTKNFDFVVEIQYLLDIDAAANFRPARNQVAFAVTTDGHDLLVSVDDETCEILQDEFGDVDSIGVSVSDLLSGKCLSLG